jgi:hypothetical protein
MKTKLLLFIATIFLLFNSCKKIREKVFSTRMEGKVIDMQTGKGIPNAKLVVYESTGGRLQASRFLPLKTFYADKDGNFKDKIKIAFPDEEDETIEAYILKAEPDGYEKIDNNSQFPISGREIIPSVDLTLTKPNKNLELKCNPEYELEISLIDELPYYPSDTLYFAIFQKYDHNRFYQIQYPQGDYLNTVIRNRSEIFTARLPSFEFDIVIWNPGNSESVDSMRINLISDSVINFNY